jgi:hypothetical protein
MKRVKLNKSTRPKQVIKRKKIPTNPKILKLVKMVLSVIIWVLILVGQKEILFHN